MIKRLINNGFKDQTRTVDLSGLDLFTSSDVNGVGKSAVLEAFKLALVGEIPGRAKNVDDILQFTSLDEMNVEIHADTRQGPVIVGRRFLRHAPQGEKRPVLINGVAKKFEQGGQWIHQHIGGVSISFDPYEFLNLPDAKKRQWIIAHSPESRGLGPTALHTFLLARMMENSLGTGIIHSLLVSSGAASLDDFCGETDHKNLAQLRDRMWDVFRQQEPGLANELQKKLDAVFRFWSPSHSVEENSSAMLKHLKSETLRLKHMVRDQSAALSCMGPDSREGVDSGKDPQVSDLRKIIRNLSASIASLDVRMEKIRHRAAAKIKRDFRIIFLKENITRLVEKLGGDMSKALIEMRDQLHHKRVNPEDLQEKLKELNRQLSRWSAEYQELKSGLQKRGAQIKLKRDKLQTLGASQFACPIAADIRCDTDMTPYREILEGEIELLQQEEMAMRPISEKARQKAVACQHEIDALDLNLADQLRANREIQREIDLLQEQIQTEEKETAKARGRLTAYREEMNVVEEEMNAIEEEVSALETESLAFSGESDEVETLEDEKTDLKRQMEQKQEALDAGLRRQGKIEAFSKLNSQKQQGERELAIVKQLLDLLGGIQKKMAARVAHALETEVNDVLKLIDSDYDFTLNLTGKIFEMGWNREGRVIPFKTINSAHFVIFIVPFLAALIQRLARTRAKTGLPTLKALCIEAESLTPANLSALLRGLKNMQAKGVLDNVLVAHYHSLRDPLKLSGFQEHIIENAESPEEAISL